MAKTSVKKNFIYNISYQILILLLPLITSPYLSRVVGSEGLGVYSYTQATAHYFVLLIMLGIENYGNREIARVQDDKQKRSVIFSNLFSLQFILMILLSVAYIIYLNLINSEYSNIYLLQYFYIISAGFNINWFFFGMENFKITITRNIVIKILTTICIFVFVKESNDINIYTAIISIGILINNLAIWPCLFKFVNFIKPSIREIRKHLLPNLKLFIPVLAISVYNIMDKIMLGSMSTYDEVAYYTYAERIIQIPVTVIIALGTVMLPHISHLLAQGKKDECDKLFYKAMHFMTFSSVFIAFFAFDLGVPFSNWYYGESFYRCGIFITILAPAIIFKSIANVVRTQLIIPYKRDNIYIYSVCGGAVANFVVNFTLIPLIGGLGAIIGTIFAEGTVLIVQLICTRKSVNYKSCYKDLFAYLLIGFIMYFILNCLETYFIHLNSILFIAINVLIGGLIFITIMLCYLKFIKKDLSLIKTIKRVKL